MSDESPFGDATATDDSSDASQLQFQTLTAAAQISDDAFRWNKPSLQVSASETARFTS
jgi:hypothetical protein